MAAANLENNMLGSDSGSGSAAPPAAKTQTETKTEKGVHADHEDEMNERMKKNTARWQARMKEQKGRLSGGGTAAFHTKFAACGILNSMRKREEKGQGCAKFAMQLLVAAWSMVESWRADIQMIIEWVIN